MKKLSKTTKTILTIFAFILIISGLIDILFVKTPVPAWTVGAVALLMGIVLILLKSKRKENKNDHH